MNRKFKAGQSILEYTLVLGAVIAVIVAVLLSEGGIKDKIEDAYNKTGEAVSNTAADLTEGVFQD